MSRISKSIETERRLVVAKKWGKEGGGNGELLLNGYRVSVWGDEELLKIVVMTVQHCECN